MRNIFNIGLFLFFHQMGSVFFLNYPDIWRFLSYILSYFNLKCGMWVEYKTSGWKLATDRKSITFTDKQGIGKLKLKGTRDLHFYQPTQIKRVRLVKRADGYYVQFCIQVDRSEVVEVTGNAIGLDVGLKEFYTDFNGIAVDNPRFLRKGERRLKKAQRRVSKRVKGSINRWKARVILGKRHLKISRQRKDFAVKLARCVMGASQFCSQYKYSKTWPTS